jgi:hypothetical protein
MPPVAGAVLCYRKDQLPAGTGQTACITIATFAVPARNPSPKGSNMNREGCFYIVVSVVVFWSAVACLILLFI